MESDVLTKKQRRELNFQLKVRSWLTELKELRKVRDKAVQDLEMIGAGFNFLTLSVKGGDPKNQVLLRIKNEHENLMETIKLLESVTEGGEPCTKNK